MKKYMFYLIAVTVMLTTACKDDVEKDIVVSVTGVIIEQADLAIAPGNNKIMKAIVMPASATNKAVTWSSNNEATVKINSETGELSPLTQGSATVTVTTADGNFSASCNIEVKNVPVTGVEIAETEVTLAPGAKTTLIANVLSVAASNKAVTWSSENEAIVRINSTSGEVTAISVGETFVTATTVENGFKASCKVTVELVNLLVNPGFETRGESFTGLPGWTKIPAAWFTSYYGADAGVMSQYSEPAINRIGLVNESGGTEAFFTTGNGAFFAGSISGSFACRVEGNRPGGAYQLVTVTPGVKYEISIDAGYRNNNANMSIQTNTLKILSVDGLTTYYETPITPIGATTGNGVSAIILGASGSFTAPEGVTQVRFQFDQRTYSNPDQAPLALFDNCSFTQLAE